jgi:argininosuccinate synthase
MSTASDEGAGKKVVLAYSGGLDTSTVTRWLVERGWEVVCLTVDVGFLDADPGLEKRALAAGATRLIIEDAKEMFAHYFVLPALAAGAIYEERYPLATALARPLIAKLLVDVAKAEGAQAVAHGCTGKGNDQVRFDVSVSALAPELTILAPVREWELTTRPAEIAYAKEHGIPIRETTESPYSTDENLWGRSIEAGVLEDPWLEPPGDVYQWTRSVAEAPDEPEFVEVTFEEGVPVAMDGDEMGPVALIERMHELAGRHGVGRIDMVENRLVGIKSREIYEAPAATALREAHLALETLTLSKPQQRLKRRLAQDYADLIYDGLWFTAHHQDLAAYVRSTQRHVSGVVRLRLHKGTVTAVGRRSPRSLYQLSLATYDEGDQFDQGAARGFIELWGLPVRVQAGSQLLQQPGNPLQIAAGEDKPQ